MNDLVARSKRSSVRWFAVTITVTVTRTFVFFHSVETIVDTMTLVGFEQILEGEHNTCERLCFRICSVLLRVSGPGIFFLVVGRNECLSC